MIFNSMKYLIFLLIVVIFYYISPKNYKRPIILLASYYFYATYNYIMIVFLIITTIINYIFSKLIETKNRSTYLKLGVSYNLLILIFYKYLEHSIKFLVLLINPKSNINIEFNILVPIGLSFITFHAISYLVDLYNGKIDQENNSLFNLALYLSFFPKVVQGPIVKANDFYKQFIMDCNFDSERIRKSIILILWGLFVKMAVADRISVPVNLIYGNLSSFSGSSIILATFLFAIQLYCDFAGYSLIAIGSAKLFGFDFKSNFKQPYLSTSVSSFWRRWHISLNEWFIEYVYFPLGGSKINKFRTILNTLIIFTLSGIWHGSTGGYLIWGVLNGLFVVFERIIGIKSQKENISNYTHSYLLTWIKRIYTFIMTSITWLFFRSASFSSSANALKRIIRYLYPRDTLRSIFNMMKDKENIFMGLNLNAWKTLTILVMVVIVVDIVLQKNDLFTKITKLKTADRWFIYLLLIVLIVLFGMYGYGYNASNFIYSQF